MIEFLGRKQGRGGKQRVQSDGRIEFPHLELEQNFPSKMFVKENGAGTFV